ncbi:SLC13 family permease [Streptomyces sp. CWNU-52B]|uniref:SLC13 family permease n=1 Tax=unclassified Streptomyces TaxID=2593676 RepID=UPI0039BEE8DF
MIEAASVVSLLLVFAVATVLPINMGVLALTAAFVLGAASGLSSDEVFAFFPGQVFVLVVGITLLFGIARVNGTMALFLRASLRLVGHRRWAVPWLVFVVAGILMSFGFVLAVGILAPMAMSLAARFKVRPLLMAMMVSHGALAASLSPVTVYAAFTRQVADKAQIGVGSVTMFAACFLANLVFAVVIYLAWGRELWTPLPEEAQETREGREGRTAQADGKSLTLTGGRSATATGADTVPDTGTGAGPGTESAAGAVRSRTTTGTPAVAGLDLDAAKGGITPLRALTLLAVLGLVVGAALGVDVGVMGLVEAAVLLLLAPREHSDGFKDIGWNVILLICGMLTLMAVLTANGTVDHIADGAADLSMPSLAILLILLIAALLSAVGSSVATIGIALPLALPLLHDGGLSAAGVIIAISTCSLIVDVSPFSTNGALVLTNAQVANRRRFQNQMLAYTAAICLAAPLLLWAALEAVG